MAVAPNDDEGAIRRTRLAARWAAVQFGFVMLANFVVRSVREEMGVTGGVDRLPWMFTATLVATIAVVPLYGMLAGRLGRRGLATVIFGVLGTGSLALSLGFVALGPTPMLGRVAFVWISVTNVLAVAAFWSAIVDLFADERSRAHFGTIAAGGTVGALLGPALAVVLVGVIGVVGLLWVAAAASIGAIAAGRPLERAREGAPDVVAPSHPVGGGALEALVQLRRSPLLRGVAIHVVFFTTTSTVLYLLQARIVRDAIPDPEGRTALFASIDLAVNLLALAVQLLVTNRALARLPVAISLLFLPLVTAGLLLVLALAPGLSMLVAAQVVRRASEHAFGKPARELVLQRVERSAKFHGQNAVDTLVYRGGDAAAAWVVDGLLGLGLAFGPLLGGTAVLAMGWAAFVHRLGRTADAVTARGRSHSG